MQLLHRGSVARVSLLVVAALAVACGGDSNPSGPGANLSLSGDWTFTLASTDSSADTTQQGTANIEHVMLVEHDGILVGTAGTFRFEGVRRDHTVELSVYAPQKSNSYAKQTTMYLTLSGDSLTGAGSLFRPDVPKATNADGSLHEKETTPHTDTILSSGLEIYTATGVRTATLTADRAAAVQKASDLSLPPPPPSRDLGTDICNGITTISSYFVGKMTGGFLRPIGNCYLEQDGGGFYVFGRTGPGSILPMYTQTFYVPAEWAPCTSRTYGFEVSTDYTTTAQTVFDQFTYFDPNFWAAYSFGISDNQPQTALDAGFAFDQWANDLVNVTGGFAFTIVHSQTSGNWAVYANTVLPNVSYEDVYTNNPIGSIIVNALLDLAGQGHVWAFQGQDIHDHWNLQRDPTTLCSRGLDIIYLFGTDNVTYN